MPDSCGTTTRRLVVRNVKTDEEVEVLVVVGDHYVEIGDYSFEIDALRRVLGDPEEPEVKLFHPTTGETDVPA